MGALGAVLLGGVLILSAASLTTAPAFNGNEPWYLSAFGSQLDGDGYEPSLLAGSGAYDGVPDYWGSRVAALPSLLGELVFPTKPALSRLPIFLTGLVALVVFWLAMRRLLSAEIGLVATAALAATWGFYAMSHWVRWDAMAILAMCAILALLVPGPPSLRSAALVGAIMGIGPDFANAVPAAIPGVLVLCAWERERRWARVGALVGGTMAGLALFALLHFAPHPNLGQARDQFDLVFRPAGYGDIPLLEAMKDLSLEPILNERDRYSEMMLLQWQTILIALTIGVLASGVMITRTLGIKSRWLALGALAALVVIVAVPLLGSSPHTELRDAIGPMIILAAGLATVAAIDALRFDRPYPTQGVPAILLIGLLVGWALFVGNRTTGYSGYALPFAVAAAACALHSLSPRPWRTATTAAGLAAATLASSVFLASEIRAASPEPALDEEVSERAREIVPPGRSVVGEWIYWWLYRDERFRANSVIRLQAWQHPDETYAETFHRVCPDYVLLDDLWLGYYEALRLDPAIVSADNYPRNFYPVDAAERERLMALLRDEYEVAERLEAEDRTLTFWSRRASDCP